jgi:glycosyltransferase involved in cell wall biosynthesis
MVFDCLVVGSHLRFDGVWQRPQQIATRLAHRVPVLFVEESFVAERESDEIASTFGALEVMRPLRSAHAYEPGPATLAAARAWVGNRRPLVWLYTPLMSPLADAFPDASVVYDCMDELAAFDFAPVGMRERERELAERATLVFCGGASLFAARRALGSKVRLFPSGVEFDHFAAAAQPHPLFAGLPKPIFGYVGVIDERLDIDAIVALAERDANVLLVGPVAKIDPAMLPRRSNVHFTGRMPYAQLPALLAGIDVAIMPFAANRATQFISPTKTPEYLAARKPVVSTPVPDVISAYGDVVTIAAGPRAFADACMAVAATPDPERVARGVGRARNAGWDELVTRMWKDLEQE